MSKEFDCPNCGCDFEVSDENIADEIDIACEVCNMPLKLIDGVYQLDEDSICVGCGANLSGENGRIILGVGVECQICLYMNT